MLSGPVLIFIAVELLIVALSHKEINVSLGADDGYTRSIDQFIQKLDPSIVLTLQNQSSSPLKRQTSQSCAGSRSLTNE